MEITLETLQRLMLEQEDRIVSRLKKRVNKAKITPNKAKRSIRIIWSGKRSGVAKFR
jgi:hypothetical protein